MAHHLARIVLMILLGTVALTCQGAAPDSVPHKIGPIQPARLADEDLDSFESTPFRFKTWQRGKLEADLALSDEGVRAGSHCLQVTIAATRDVEGRNSINLLWSFVPPADWSDYDGLMLWYRAPDVESPGFTVSVVEADGAHYWQRINPPPRRSGLWQPIRLEHSAWSWSWEGPDDKDNKLDVTRIKQLAIEIRAAADKPIKFAIDGLGLYKKQPAYAGPRVALSCTKDGFIYPPGKDYTLVVHVDRLKAGATGTVELNGVDYEGRCSVQRVLNFRGEADSTRQTQYVRFKNRGPAYIDVDALLRVNGRPVYRAAKAVACVQPQSPEDRKPNPDSIFGIWVGGGAWNIGAKWTRTYLRGGDVKRIDGEYQFRDNAPGVYAPKADPRLNYTFYFSQMPKWLSSRPDRPDWQKWSPTNWGDYGKFVEWVVRGAKRGGFTHYEVWNEPVPYAYWMGSIESVVKLHEVTYKAIKKVQPDAVVLGPCPYTFVWNYIDRFFELGGARWIDGVVIHAYSGNPDIDLAANLRKLKNMMRKHGIGGRDIYITELGYATPKVTEHEQAQYLVRAYMHAWSEGVRLLNWHMLWDYSGKGDPAYAILRHDRTPRPAYVAYATMTRLLERATYEGKVTGVAASQRGFRFRKHGQIIRVPWDTSGTSTLVLNGIQSAEIVKLMGTATTRRRGNHAMRIALTPDPVYVLSAN